MPYRNAKSDENEVISANGDDHKSARNLESYTQKKLSSLCDNGNKFVFVH